MVETAPLPPGFPAPIDADTLPVRKPHPMEAWGSAIDRPSAVEQIIRKPLEGGGYLDASETALRNLQLAQEQMRARAATIRHPGAIAAERAAWEAVRFKWVGKIGQVELQYDRVTGRYSEVHQQRDYSSRYGD